MNKNIIKFSLISFFSLVAGYLLSAISFVGRIGIGLFYQQYRFLKVWWKGAFFVFVAWSVIWAIQYMLRKKISVKKSNIVLGISIIMAFAGLFYSYLDFRHTLSHRWLGERFHLGVYLFWIGWIAITISVSMERGMIEKEKDPG